MEDDGTQFVEQRVVVSDGSCGTPVEVDLVEVTWHSGQIDVYKNIAADQHLVLKEGETR